MKSDLTSKTPRASASEDSDIKEKVTRSKTSKLDENSSKLTSHFNLSSISLQPLEPRGYFEKPNQYGQLRDHWLAY